MVTPQVKPVISHQAGWSLYWKTFPVMLEVILPWTLSGTVVNFLALHRTVFKWLPRNQNHSIAHQEPNQTKINASLGFICNALLCLFWSHDNQIQSNRVLIWAVIWKPIRSIYSSCFVPVVIKWCFNFLSLKLLSLIFRSNDSFKFCML